MTQLSHELQEILSKARSVIRDQSVGTADKDLVESPQLLCQRISKALGEEYDFALDKVTALPPARPMVYRVEHASSHTALLHILNDLAYEGYAVHPLHYNQGMWTVVAVNPSIITSQQQKQGVAALCEKLGISADALKL